MTFDLVWHHHATLWKRYVLHKCPVLDVSTLQKCFINKLCFESRDFQNCQCSSLPKHKRGQYTQIFYLYMLFPSIYLVYSVPTEM